MIPDAAAIVMPYLADTTASRVVSRTPDSLQLPWVRVTEIDAVGDPKSRADHLIDFIMQFECYAGKEAGTDAQGVASDLVRSVRQALSEFEGVYEGVTVNGVRFAGMPRIPDTSIEPAMERFILTAHIYMHS
jgi:hypothetical protein